MRPKTHLDLCSGIAGFALAAGWNGYETIGFCEINGFCTRIIRHHYPGVPIHEDISTLTGDIVRSWARERAEKVDSHANRAIERGGDAHDTGGPNAARIDLLTAGY